MFPFPQLTFVGVVQRPAGGEGSAESAGCEQRHFGRIVTAAGPHIVNEDKAGVIENGSITFGHRVKPSCQTGQLAAIVARDTFPFF